MIDRYEKFVLYFCATSLGLLFISMAFVSQYYNYGAESVTAFSTLRVAKGLWHATDTADLPVTIYHYGGIFPYLVGLPLRLFSITDVYFVNILSKLAMCLLFFCNIKIILIYLKRFKPSFAIDAVVYSTLLFLLILPTLLFAYRPDLLCALCELGGFFLLFKHLEFKHESSRSIILAGMLFALATTLKFNSVSILVGCCAYLLFARNIRRLVVISTAYLSTLLVVGGLYHITFGPDYWVQSVFVASSGLPTLRAVSDLVIRLINEIGFRLILFHLIIVFGVINLKRARAHWRMCVCAVVSSLFFASIGQINIGAYYNYYYTYFFLAIFLAPFAYDEFLKIDWTIRRPVAITFSVLYLLLGVDSIKTSVQIYLALLKFVWVTLPGGHGVAAMRGWCNRV